MPRSLLSCCCWPSRWRCSSLLRDRWVSAGGEPGLSAGWAYVGATSASTSADVAPGEVVGPARPERGRQVDAAAGVRRAAEASTPARSRVDGRAGRTRARSRVPPRAADRAGLPGLPAVPAPDRARERGLRAAAAGWRSGPGAGPRPGWNGSGVADLAAPGRACPAASRSAWRWPGRWPPSRGCSCWTSRWPRSTPVPGWRSAALRRHLAGSPGRRAGDPRSARRDGARRPAGGARAAAGWCSRDLRPRWPAGPRTDYVARLVGLNLLAGRARAARWGLPADGSVTLAHPSAGVRSLVAFQPAADGGAASTGIRARLATCRLAGSSSWNRTVTADG